MTDLTRYTSRTVDDVLAMITSDEFEQIMFRDVLYDALPFERAKPYLTEEFLAKPTAAAEWAETGLKLDTETLHEAACDYLEFAYGKALGHRGISAARSVDKMTQYCWLLGADWDLVTDAGYANYGAPGLKAAAEFLQHPWPEDEELERMSQGRTCSPGCREGCGQ